MPALIAHFVHTLTHSQSCSYAARCVCDCQWAVFFFLIYLNYYSLIKSEKGRVEVLDEIKMNRSVFLFYFSFYSSVEFVSPLIHLCVGSVQSPM